MAKGQPDFFGQPTQIRYGQPELVINHSDAISAAMVLNEIVLMKGVFVRVFFRYQTFTSHLLVAQYITLDGLLISSSRPYDCIRHHSFSLAGDKPRSVYLDTLYHNYTFVYEANISIETSLQILCQGLPGCPAAGLLNVLAFAQRVL
jgi:hypothetical protein